MLVHILEVQEAEVIRQVLLEEVLQHPLELHLPEALETIQDLLQVIVHSADPAAAHQDLLQEVVQGRAAVAQAAGLAVLEDQDNIRPHKVVVNK